MKIGTRALHFEPHCGSRFKICLPRMKRKYRLNEHGCRARTEGGWITWVCTPNSVIQPLQKIQNFAARLVLLAPRRHHSTPLLEKLHWLPISERIKCKVACMCFSAINGSAPAYLSELIDLDVYTPSRSLRSSSDTRMLKIQQYKRKAFALSLALDPTFGIHFHKTLDTAQPCHLLKPN